MSTLVIIANPHAQRNRLWPLAAEALRKAAPGAPILETGTEEELQRAAAAVADDPPKILAIAGGDGTIQHTLTALHARLGNDLPPISLLGGGALDSLAGGLGGRGAAEDRLRKLSEALGGGGELKTEERDTLSVDGRLGFRLGAGLPQRFLESVYATGHPGPWTSLALVARGLGSSAAAGRFAKALYQRLDLTVAIDGEDWPQLPLFGLICSSVAESGLGLRPFRRAVEQPGFFQILGLTGRPLQFALELPRLVFGRPARRDRILDSVGELVELRGRPFRYFLDGEMHPCDGRLTVKTGPRVRLVHA